MSGGSSTIQIMRICCEGVMRRLFRLIQCSCTIGRRRLELSHLFDASCCNVFWVSWMASWRLTTHRDVPWVERQLAMWGNPKWSTEEGLMGTSWSSWCCCVDTRDATGCYRLWLAASRTLFHQLAGLTLQKVQVDWPAHLWHSWTGVLMVKHGKMKPILAQSMLLQI
jgi:hypothetical protein